MERLSLCVRLNTNIVLFTALFLLCAPPIKAQVVDFFEHECGQIACAFIYQGEGVNYPQVIVSMYQKGSGVNRPYITFVYDYPPGKETSVSTYINMHLAHRSGGPFSVSYTQDDMAFMYSMWPVILEGFEQAYRSPSTDWLGVWPSNAEWRVIGEQIKEGIGPYVQWDIDNGFTEPPEPEVTEGISVGDEIILGPPCGPGSAQGIECQSLGDESTHELLQGITGFTAERQRELPDIDLSAIVQQLAVFRNEPSTSVAIGDEILEQVATMETVIQRDLTSSLSDIFAVDRQSPQSGATDLCKVGILEAFESLNACRDHCDTCKKALEAEWWLDAGIGCGLVAGSGASVLILLAPETLGTSLIPLLGFELAALGACTKAVVAVLAIELAKFETHCKQLCQIIAKAKEEEQEGG